MQLVLPRFARPLLLQFVLLGACVPSASGGQHPTLLIDRYELPRLQHICGVGEPAAAPRGFGAFGRGAADYQRLRNYFANRPAEDPMAAEAVACGFLHLVDPAAAERVDRLVLISQALLSPPELSEDPVALVVALDWAWSDIDEKTRRDFLINLRRLAKPLTPADSPLDHRAFRERLAGIALALVVDEQDDPSGSWAAQRTQIIEAAVTYFRRTLPTFIAWRGLTPTGVGAAAWEESDTSLAIELAQRILVSPTWDEQRGGVGRWMEHYVLADAAQPWLRMQFPRDDGSSAPLSPAGDWTGLLPVSAHLIAARTADPAAATVADNIERQIRSAEKPAGGGAALADLWSWVPIVFELPDIRRCDVARLPKARNLGGAVVLRGGTGLEETVIWIETAQPYLRRRQHFDAGHFMIRRGGLLTPDAGEDVTFEATPQKGGEQKLGLEKGSFDYEQFFVSTIAHNCIVLWDPAIASQWYKNVFVPSGNQRLIEQTCTDFTGQFDASPRRTGRLIGYGSDEAGTYVAIDLTSAYEPRDTSRYTREFVFFDQHALLVIDRIAVSRARSVPTWVLNLPSRPSADGRDLSDDARVAGPENSAGVWRYDSATWLRCEEREGALWVRPLLPARRHVALVGGPARKELILRGPHAGRTYVGGEASSFERLAMPTRSTPPRNVWYRLGEPTLLGEHFGRIPHWGRVEIEPAVGGQEQVFITLLVASPAAAKDPPNYAVEQTEDLLRLSIDRPAGAVDVVLPAKGTLGGVIEVRGAEPRTWSLPQTVLADEPLPTRAGAAGEIGN